MPNVSVTHLEFCYVSCLASRFSNHLSQAWRAQVLDMSSLYDLNATNSMNRVAGELIRFALVEFHEIMKFLKLEFIYQLFLRRQS